MPKMNARFQQVFDYDIHRYCSFRFVLHPYYNTGTRSILMDTVDTQ